MKDAPSSSVRIVFLFKRCSYPVLSTLKGLNIKYHSAKSSRGSTLDFIPLLTMSSGRLPGIQTLNNFPGLSTLHLRHSLLLSAVGNTPLFPCSALTTALLASFPSSCAFPRVQTHLQVHTDTFQSKISTCI